MKTSTKDRDEVLIDPEGDEMEVALMPSEGRAILYAPDGAFEVTSHNVDRIVALLREATGTEAVREHWEEEGRRAAAMYRGGSSSERSPHAELRAQLEQARGEAEDAVRWVAERHKNHPWSTVDLTWERDVQIGPSPSLSRNADGEEPIWALAQAAADEVSTRPKEKVRAADAALVTPTSERKPTPGYVPAVRRVEAWQCAPLQTPRGTQFGTFEYEPAEAYEQAATNRMYANSESSGRLFRRCDALDNAGEYWGCVHDRLAAFLCAQDRKHGGGQ